MIYFFSIIKESDSWTSFSICVISIAKSFRISVVFNELTLDADFKLLVSEYGGRIALRGFPSRPNAGSSPLVVNNFALICLNKTSV